MATFEQRESGWWQAKIRRKGHPAQSKTFERKAEAESWARSIENEMDRGIFVSRTEAERTTFAQAAARYAEEILPKKKGKEQDSYRLQTLVREFGSYSLAAITSTMLATFRDKRLETLAPQTVVHDLNLLSRVFRAATLDWGIALPAGVPTAMVRKPSINNKRTRRLVGDEEARLLASIDNPGPGSGKNRWTKPVVQLAIETSARQSELLSLDWRDVNLPARVIRLRGVGGGKMKNDANFRDVPLSRAAVKILEKLAGKKNGKVMVLPRGKVFATTASAIKQSWERAVVRARSAYEREVLLSGLLTAGMGEREAVTEIRKVIPSGGRKPAKTTPPRKATLEIVKRLAEDPLLVDLHFHDLRHEATSRLAEKLQLHELMKVTGHEDTRMLARYYHPRAEDLARKLG